MKLICINDDGCALVKKGKIYDGELKSNDRWKIWGVFDNYPKCHFKRAIIKINNVKTL